MSREEKISKLIEELKEEVLAQRHAVDEKFSGVITFRFDLRSGGVIGSVRVEKDGRVIKV